MQTKTYTTEAGAKKAVARAYSPAIVRLSNGRYTWFQSRRPLPQGARIVSRWGVNQWRASKEQQNVKQQNVTIGRILEGDEPMAALYCSCEQRPQIWGEFWWTGEKHDWIFFDDRETSETYTQRITSCRACGQQLERKNLEAVTYPAQQWEVRRVEALANRACKEPAVAHYICLLAKTLEKGPWPSQAFIRGMIQADGQSLPITHLHQGEAAGASGQSPRGSSDSPRLTETKKEKEEQA